MVCIVMAYIVMATPKKTMHSFDDGVLLPFFILPFFWCTVISTTVTGQEPHRLRTYKAVPSMPECADDGWRRYVVDTGVNVAHEEFEGRASEGWSECGSFFFQGMPTANAEGYHRSEGNIGKVSTTHTLGYVQTGTSPRCSPSILRHR